MQFQPLYIQTTADQAIDADVSGIYWVDLHSDINTT